jgi:hypothetical protein
MASAVLQLLSSDRWTVAHGTLDAGPYIIRYREPVLGPGEVGEYTRCLRIVCGYAEDESGLLPDASTSTQLQTFEAILLAVLESGAHAVLTAVVTFDGARQWVFYAKDPATCGALINKALQPTEQLPLEIDSFDDQTWDYLRNEVLLRVKSSPV